MQAQSGFNLYHYILSAMPLQLRFLRIRMVQWHRYIKRFYNIRQRNVAAKNSFPEKQFHRWVIKTVQPSNSFHQSRSKKCKMIYLGEGRLTLWSRQNWRRRGVSFTSFSEHANWTSGFQMLRNRAAKPIFEGDNRHGLVSCEREEITRNKMKKKITTRLVIIFTLSKININSFLSIYIGNWEGETTPTILKLGFILSLH